MRVSSTNMTRSEVLVKRGRPKNRNDHPGPLCHRATQQHSALTVRSTEPIKSMEESASPLPARGPTRV